MKRKALDSITKISKLNLDRIIRLKITGYEPNDFVINLALDILENNKHMLAKPDAVKVKPGCTTKISKDTLARISKLKLTGYEPNDFIIGKALELLDKKRKINNG